MRRVFPHRVLNLSFLRTPLIHVICITSLSSSVFAGPEGGEVVGGAGNISRSGNTTTINQDTHNMAIDWQSFDVNANELVLYIYCD